MISDKVELKPKIDRSPAYPSISLDDAIDKLQRLIQMLGFGPYSRQSAAQGLGYAGLNGKSQRVVAALVHYGLLSREGNSYRATPIAKVIVHPPTDEQKNEAIRESALKPRIYAALVEKFANQTLPIQLANILINEYQINRNAAAVLANNFRYSLEYAGLLSNGIVVLENQENDEMSNSDEVTHKEKEAVYPTIQKNMTYEVRAKSSSYDTPALPSGIVVRFPENLTQYFVLGDFANEIKSLEDKAQQILSQKENKKV